MAIFGLFFSLFLSRSLFVVCALLALAGWLLSGQYRERAVLLARNPGAWLTIIFVIYIFVSAALTFNGADTKTALKVYWQLLLIPVIATTMTGRGDLTRCWNAYAIGAGLLLVHIFLLNWYAPPWVTTVTPSSVFFNPLPQSVSLAIFSGWCVHRLLVRDQRFNWRLLFFAGLAASTWAVLAVSQQRLGFLTWIIMVGAGIVLRIPQEFRWKAVVIVALALMTLLLADQTIRDRISLGIHEFQAYDHKPDFSSIGSRRYMWETAWLNIQQAPWLGHGTGSYHRVSERAFDDPSMCSIGCIHPHQQYLLFWLELGLVGLFLFFGVLVSIAMYHLRHRRFHSLAIPLLVVFCLSGLVETPLWYRGFLYLFVPLLGLLTMREISELPAQSTVDKSG